MSIIKIGDPITVDDIMQAFKDAPKRDRGTATLMVTPDPPAPKLAGLVVDQHGRRIRD